MIYFVIIKSDNLGLNFSRNFEIVASYFYPKPYTAYGELGRIRGKYPKLINDTYYYSVSRRISILERKSC